MLLPGRICQGAIQFAQIIQKSAQIRMIGSEQIFANFQGPLVKLPRLAVLPLSLDQLPQVVQCAWQAWMIRAVGILENLQGARASGSAFSYCSRREYSISMALKQVATLG